MADQTVNGVPVPVNIPDGSPTVPGKGYVFGLAIYPRHVGTVTVSNSNYASEFRRPHRHAHAQWRVIADVLNNHDSFGSSAQTSISLLYDDSAGGGLIGSRPSDGPGSLIGYMGQQGSGRVDVDRSGRFPDANRRGEQFHLTIQPHQDLLQGDYRIVPATQLVLVGFIDVPPGATNLTDHRHKSHRHGQSTAGTVCQIRLGTDNE